MKFKHTRVDRGGSHDPLGVASSEFHSHGNTNRCRSASALNFQSDGNSNKRLRDHWFLKKFKFKCEFSCGVNFQRYVTGFLSCGVNFQRFHYRLPVTGLYFARINEVIIFVATVIKTVTTVILCGYFDWIRNGDKSLAGSFEPSWT